MYVLIVEPDAVQRETLHGYLQHKRYLVDDALTYATAVEKLARHDFDFVLLAQNPGDYDALTLLRDALRRPGQTASFIILTDSLAIEDRLRSFDLGADDCLPKSVALPELERRMQAIVRRRFGLKGPEIPFGPGFVLDASARILRYGQRTVPLSSKQFDLLHYLLLHRGTPLTREQLGTHLWGDDTASRRTSNYIDVHIKNLRKALAGFAEPNFLETVHHFGYRLAA